MKVYLRPVDGYSPAHTFDLGHVPAEDDWVALPGGHLWRVEHRRLRLDLAEPFWQLDITPAH